MSMVLDSKEILRLLRIARPINIALHEKAKGLLTDIRI